MSEDPLGTLVRLLAGQTPEQLARSYHLLMGQPLPRSGSGSTIPKTKRLRGVGSCAVGQGREALPTQSAGVRPEEILARGRLRYSPGFRDVWVGDTHYDLRERAKARLCLQYLVEREAFDTRSARHLVDEIDPYVRMEGDFPPAADIKIDHYFNDRSGKLPRLRRELVASAGRNGRYFLRVG
jgi:hypothetical protein